MTDQEQDKHRYTGRALEALSQAIAAQPDDFDHPGYDLLEALADGRLPDGDREAVESHIDACRSCAEDLADLSAMRIAMNASARPAPVPPRRLRIAMLSAVGIAAALLLALWLGGRSSSTPATSGSPAPAIVAAGPLVPGAAPPLTADEQQLVSRAIETGRVDLPFDARTLAGRPGTLLGGGQRQTSFSPIAPTGTAVLSARPAFSWRPAQGALAYTVTIFDERFAEAGRSARLPGTAWIPDADLTRGATYVWQVTAHLRSGEVIAPAPQQPEARFRIVDAPTAAAIAEQQTRLAGEPLALGILLARAGLLDDAARELDRAASRSSERASARQLLASLRSVR